MSKKIKLVLFIICFLILILLISAITYKMFFYKEETKEVIAVEETKPTEMLKEEQKEVIVVVLNEKTKETNNKLKENKKQINNKTEATNHREEENISKPQEKNEQKNNTKTEATNKQEEKSEPTDFYIKVNYGANVINVYCKDEDGEYTVPHKAFICSTGTATPTSGTYNTDYKYRWISLFGNVYGQYATRIVGNILFHSVPYLEKGNYASLEYWEYDKLRNCCFNGVHKNDCKGC